VSYAEIDDVVCQVAPLLLESQQPLARRRGWEILHSTLTPQISKALRTSRLSETDRDDCCQDIWLALSQPLPRMNRAHRSFGAWRHGLIRNKMIDRLRHSRRRNTQPLPDCESKFAIHLLQTTRITADKVEQLEEVQRLLRRAESKFSPEHFNAFRLRYLEEKSIVETANQLNLTTDQVRQISHRVLKSLRNTGNRNF
jgi:RNA polymerase sigma factor (sigma-70 family)